MLVTFGARDSSVSMKPMPMQVSIWYVYMCQVLQKYNGEVRMCKVLHKYNWGRSWRYSKLPLSSSRSTDDITTVYLRCHMSHAVLTMLQILP